MLNPFAVFSQGFVVFSFSRYIFFVVYFIFLSIYSLLQSLSALSCECMGILWKCTKSSYSEMGTSQGLLNKHEFLWSDRLQTLCFFCSFALSLSLLSLSLAQLVTLICCVKYAHKKVCLAADKVTSTQIPNIRLHKRSTNSFQIPTFKMIFLVEFLLMQLEFLLRIQQFPNWVLNV